MGSLLQLCGVKIRTANDGSYAAEIRGVNESWGLFLSSTVTDKGVVLICPRLPLAVFSGIANAMTPMMTRTRPPYRWAVLTAVLALLAAPAAAQYKPKPLN